VARLAELRELGMSAKGDADCLPSRQGRRNPARTITSTVPQLFQLIRKSLNHGIAARRVCGISTKQHAIARLIHKYLGRGRQRLSTAGESASDNTSKPCLVQEIKNSTSEADNTDSILSSYPNPISKLLSLRCSPRFGQKLTTY
jgi:hypothetical protein